MIVMLSADGLDDVTLWGTSHGSSYLLLRGDPKGWYSHPNLKVPSVARSMGDGDFDVEDASVLYASRTVTLGVAAVATTRRDALALMESVNSLAHRNVVVRVREELEPGGLSVVGVGDVSIDGGVLSVGGGVDDGHGDHDTWSVGYLRAEWDDTHADDGMAEGKLTVVCPDPRRLSTRVRTARMLGGAALTSGLVFDGKQQVKWPISFGASAAVQSLCTIRNAGTSVAYPTMTIGGASPNGWHVIDVSTGDEVSSRQDPHYNPIELHCMSSTARQGGIDITRRLDSRRFPAIEPGGSVTLILQADAGCTCEVTSYDTYI